MKLPAPCLWLGSLFFAHALWAADSPPAAAPARSNTAVIPAVTLSIPRHVGFVEQAKKGGYDVLFLGDSITDWWVVNGPEAFAKNFAGWKIANFGIAGETTQQVLWRLQNGEGQGPAPKVVM